MKFKSLICCFYLSLFWASSQLSAEEIVAGQLYYESVVITSDASDWQALSPPLLLPEAIPFAGLQGQAAEELQVVQLREATGVSAPYEWRIEGELNGLQSLNLLWAQPGEWTLGDQTWTVQEIESEEVIQLTPRQALFSQLVESGAESKTHLLIADSGEVTNGTSKLSVGLLPAEEVVDIAEGWILTGGLVAGEQSAKTFEYISEEGVVIYPSLEDGETISYALVVSSFIEELELSAAPLALSAAASSSSNLLVNGSLDFIGPLDKNHESGGHASDFEPDFNWGRVSIDGWQAVVGNLVEVWDTGGIELNGKRGNYGIQQTVNLDAGAYVLVWNHRGRSDLRAKGSPYKVNVSNESVSPAASLVSKSYRPGFSFTQTFSQNVLAFTVPADGIPVKVSFAPSRPRLGLGALVDDIELLKVDIEVDDSDSETEKVDSVSGVSDALHFVTVARQDDVVLKADLPDSIKDQVSWETTAAGITLTESASDKRIVSLSTEAENTRNGVQVPFKLKVGGTIVKEGNIWIVWADFTSDPNVGSIQEVFNDATGYKAEQGHLVTFQISPASLFSASERPDILGESSAPIPGAGDVHPLLGTSYSDGGLFRLDPSRSYSFSTSLPAGISIDDFNFNDSVTSPPASVAFPSDPMFGNDDTGGSDPDEPPSNQFIIAFDRPSVSIDNDKSPTDSNDNIINWNVTFEHFFRIDVGGVWYPASDRLQSEFDINLIYQAGRWGLLEEESSE